MTKKETPREKRLRLSVCEKYDYISVTSGMGPERTQAGMTKFVSTMLQGLAENGLLVKRMSLTAPDVNGLFTALICAQYAQSKYHLDAITSLVSKTFMLGDVTAVKCSHEEIFDRHPEYRFQWVKVISNGTRETEIPITPEMEVEYEKTRAEYLASDEWQQWLKQWAEQKALPKITTIPPRAQALIDEHASTEHRDSKGHVCILYPDLEIVLTKSGDIYGSQRWHSSEPPVDGAKVTGLPHTDREHEVAFFESGTDIASKVRSLIILAAEGEIYVTRHPDMSTRQKKDLPFYEELTAEETVVA